MRAPLVDGTGAARGEVDLPERVFGVTPHPAVVHEVLTWQLAGRRLGTHATRTRGEVRGGGRKPWRQKGTGRARHGSRRSPLWVGGGIVFGPRPRSHAYTLPRRVRRLAVRSLLADRARAGQLTVVEEIRLQAPRTRELAELLARLDLRGERVLLVTAAHDPALVRAAQNLPQVRVLTARTLNVHDLLAFPRLVLTRDAVDTVQEVWGDER
ncbi:MAG: 50S ribosomal protein L4 [Armatimonadota bacterium]|nr:50S ribosomal protein L4 [Armatimonadota bacterium]MDR7470401.1 50S ribosomal protein L4 [Armatimonadota bacterium]MDR7473483.1 50S ribosomal protein L4 [Armatimonadota bacterium]MDR7540160.1 50S ribosomal protein L4 [Armatimonadota bacterium]